MLLCYSLKSELHYDCSDDAIGVRRESFFYPCNYRVLWTTMKRDEHTCKIFMGLIFSPDYDTKVTLNDMYMC